MRRAVVAFVLALAIAAPAFAAFPGNDPSESPRLNTPNDPSFDRCEADDEDTPDERECTSYFEEQFGFFGVSMTLVSWFVGGCLVIVASVALGPVLASESGWIGRLVRGPDEDLLRPGAPASAPPVGEAVSPWRIVRQRPAPDEKL